MSEAHQPIVQYIKSNQLMSALCLNRRNRHKIAKKVPQASRLLIAELVNIDNKVASMITKIKLDLEEFRKLRMKC